MFAASDDAENVEDCGTGSADCTAGTFFKNMVMGSCEHFLFISFTILRRLGAFVLQRIH